MWKASRQVYLWCWERLLASFSHAVPRAGYRPYVTGSIHGGILLLLPYGVDWAAADSKSASSLRILPRLLLNYLFNINLNITSYLFSVLRLPYVSIIWTYIVPHVLILERCCPILFRNYFLKTSGQNFLWKYKG